MRAHPLYTLFSLLLVVLQVGLCRSYAFTDRVVQVDQAFGPTDLLPFLSVLPVQDARLTVQDLLQEPGKHPFRQASSREMPFDWNTEAHVWARFTLRNTSGQTRDLMLEQGYVTFNEVLFYEVEEGRLLRQNVSGDRYPFDSRLIPHRKFLYPVQLPPNTTRTYFFRVTNNGKSATMLFAAAPAEQFWRADGHHQLVLGGFLALLLVLVFYHLALFLYLKDRVFLYFGVFLASLLLLFVTLSGLSFQHFWPNSPEWADKASHMFLFGFIFFSFVLTQEFLNHGHFSSRYIRAVSFLKYFSLFLVITTFSSGYLNYLSTRLTFLMLLLGHGSLLLMGIYSLQKRHWYARFYIVGMVIVVGMLVIGPEISTAEYRYTAHYTLVIMTLYVLLLTLSLLDRLKDYKEEKEQAQQLAIERLKSLNSYKELVNKELQQKVEEKTLEIMHKQKEINRSVFIGEERERKRVAEELHDGLGSLLSALKLNVELIDFPGKRFAGKEAVVYHNVIEMIDRACAEVRNISHNMLPPTLSHFGLALALENMARQINQAGKVQVEVDVFGFDERIDPHTELNIYRITLELLNNTIKHAGGTKAVIQLIQQDNYVSLLVEDNGVGFDPAGVHKGIGLANIRSRVDLMGGNISLDSSPRQGTTVIINVPLKTRINGYSD